MTAPIEFVVAIARILERLGIPYHVGGSVAASIHGRPRLTADVDVVIDATGSQLLELAEHLDPEFYVSRTAIEEALKAKSTFNAIHLATAFKIDFFLVGPSAFDREELARSVTRTLGETNPHDVRVKAPEDLVLRKLLWFRSGGEVSELQWQDVIQVLASTGGSLDHPYLDRWADELGLTDLLARARKEA